MEREYGRCGEGAWWVKSGKPEEDNFSDMRRLNVRRDGARYMGDHEVGRIAAGAGRAIVYILKINF